MGRFLPHQRRRHVGIREMSAEGERLLHYGARPLRFDAARTYRHPEAHSKPSGLWVSVEGEYCWRTWCEGERWNLQGLKYVSEVTLAPEANIVQLDSLQKLDEFHARYSNDGGYIRCDRVQAAHGGVLISPYRWERRLNFLWYYGWDCASGVIWDLGAVEAVSPSRETGIEQEATKEKERNETE